MADLEPFEVVKNRRRLRPTEPTRLTFLQRIAQEAKIDRDRRGEVNELLDDQYYRIMKGEFAGTVRDGEPKERTKYVGCGIIWLSLAILIIALILVAKCGQSYEGNW